MDVIKREKLDDFEVVWVDAKNEVHMTPGIEKDLKVLKQPTPGQVSRPAAPIRTRSTWSSRIWSCPA